jgi:hypothetical protein
MNKVVWSHSSLKDYEGTRAVRIGTTRLRS